MPAAIPVLVWLVSGCTAPPFTLERESGFPVGSSQVKIADLDADGTSDIINWTERHVVASASLGRSFNILDYHVGEGETLWPDLVPIEDPPHSMVALRLLREGMSEALLLDLAPSAAESGILLQPFAAQCWPQRGGGNENMGAIAPFALLRDHEPPLLLATIETAYYEAPRGLLGYSWPDGRLLWEQRMGPNLSHRGLAEADQDGEPEIFIGNYTPHNFPGDVPDTTCCVYRFQLDGTETWRRRVGGHYVEATFVIKDTNGDGQPEVMVGVFCDDKNGPRGGALILDSATGKELARSPWEADVGLHPVMLDSGKVQVLAVDMRLGEAFFLGDDLSILARRRIDHYRLGFIGVMQLEASGRSRPALVFQSARRVTVCNEFLKPVLWYDFGNERNGVWIGSEAGRPSLLVVRENDRLDVLRPRALTWFERYWSWLLAGAVVVLAVLAGLWWFLKVRKKMKQAALDSLRAHLIACGDNHRPWTKCLSDLPALAESIVDPDTPPEPRAGFIRQFDEIRERYLKHGDHELRKLARNGGRAGIGSPSLRREAVAAMKELRNTLSAFDHSRPPDDWMKIDRPARRIRTWEQELASEVKTALATPLGAAWRAVVSEHAPHLAASGIRLEGPAPDELGRVHVVLPEAILRDALGEAISNSAEALGTPRSGGARDIKLWMTTSASWVTLQISDTGTGLTISDPFRPGRSSRGAGRGHGLSKIRADIEGHGGAVRFVEPPEEWSACLEVVLQRAPGNFVEVSQ